MYANWNRNCTKTVPIQINTTICSMVAHARHPKTIFFLTFLLNTKKIQKFFKCNRKLKPFRFKNILL